VPDDLAAAPVGDAERLARPSKLGTERAERLAVDVKE
jgi:hypothetical protein